MDRPQPEVSEEFLFHVFRGSELLGDNRVQEAKEEIERALALRPGDAKARDLLAAVHFRVGSYGRAQELYEELVTELPDEPPLLLNLGLCLLRSGDAARARDILSHAVELSPDHKRAWGYLGLAHERIGELALAREAFERGGHYAMLRRLDEQAAGEGAYQIPPSGDFHELDAGELNPRLVAIPPAAPLVVVAPVSSEAQVMAPPAPPVPRVEEADLGDVHRTTDAPIASARVLGERLALSADGPPMRVDSSTAVVRLTGRPMVVRAEAVRAYTGTLHTEPMERRSRGGGLGEVLGGLTGRLIKMDGDGQIVLAPRHAHRLTALRVESEPVFIREEAVVAFDHALTFESGKIARPDDEPIFLLHLRGDGEVVIEALDRLSALVATDTSSVTVRGSSLLGWVGRLVPQLVSPADAPLGNRGLISLAGAGIVLVAGR